MEVLFRADDATIAEADAAQITGTVEAAFFLGGRTRLFLHIGGAKPLVVETSARRKFRHGDQVGLTIDPRWSIEM